MAPMIATGALPAVSPEVLAFAAEQEVTAYLPAIVEMTRRIFPTAPLKVLVEDDPEIANDRHIVLEVDTNGMTTEEITASWRRWTRESLRHCPSTHIYVFRLGIV